MKRTTKIGLLKTGGFISLITPLSIAVGINFDHYVSQSGDGGIKLAIGGGIVATLLLISFLGRVKMPGRIWFFAILYAVATLLEPILVDIKLLTGMLLLGEGIDVALFNPLIKKQVKLKGMEEQADITKKAIEKMNVIKEKEEKKIIGRV